MAHISYTELRQNLARYMDEAVESRAPIVVTRQGGKGNVVILSQEEFEGWEETIHAAQPTPAASCNPSAPPRQARLANTTSSRPSPPLRLEGPLHRSRLGGLPALGGQ